MAVINNYGSNVVNQSGGDINIGTQNNGQGFGNPQDDPAQQAVLTLLEDLLQQTRRSTASNKEEQEKICAILVEMKNTLRADESKANKLKKMSQSMNVLGGISSAASLCLQIRSLVL